MKKTKLFTIISFLFLLFVGSSIQPQQVTANEGETYVIGTDTAYAPFQFENTDGEFVGIDMEILDAIAQDQGFDYEINRLGFNGAVQGLESRQVDAVMAGMGITEERQQSFDFTDPYFETATMFAVESDSPYETLEDLEGENVAVKIGTTGADVAAEVGQEIGFTTTPFDDSVNMYEDVMAGNSAAAVEDEPVMAFAIATGQIDFRIIGEPLDSVPLGVAVNKGENQEFVEMFNEGLENIQASGEYDEIVNKYTDAEFLEDQVQTGGIVSIFVNNFADFMEGLGVTLLITLVAIVLAMIVGILIGLMRVSGNKLLSGIGILYVDMVRGIPLIVLAFFIYFGIPQLTGITLNAVVAGIITLFINSSAYIGEIVRGGIDSIDPGQMEAGRSLGLSRGTTMKRIILPQAVKVMVPSLINQFVITLKDSSILSVIGLVELTQTGQIIIARTYQSGVIWVIVGLIYIVVITSLTKLSNFIERKWVKNG